MSFEIQITYKHRAHSYVDIWRDINQIHQRKTESRNIVQLSANEQKKMRSSSGDGGERSVENETQRKSSKS